MDFETVICCECNRRPTYHDNMTTCFVCEFFDQAQVDLANATFDREQAELANYYDPTNYKEFA